MTGVQTCALPILLMTKVITIAVDAMGGDGDFGRAEVLKQKKVKKRSTVHLKLFTGKKREIRRIFSFLNIRLFSLKRIQYGPISLGDLPRGEWRYLNDAEVNQLKTFNRSK